MKLKLLLILVFLSVQTLSVLHMAEHGFAEHKHHGKTCDVQIFCEQGKLTGGSFLPSLPVLTFFVIQNTHAITIAGLTQAYSPSTPRAPPAAII